MLECQLELSLTLKCLQPQTISLGHHVQCLSDLLLNDIKWYQYLYFLSCKLSLMLFVTSFEQCKVVTIHAHRLVSPTQPPITWVIPSSKVTLNTNYTTFPKVFKVIEVISLTLSIWFFVITFGELTKSHCISYLFILEQKKHDIL